MPGKMQIGWLQLTKTKATQNKDRKIKEQNKRTKNKLKSSQVLETKKKVFTFIQDMNLNLKSMNGKEDEIIEKIIQAKLDII